VLNADRGIGAVASKVLDWDGKLVDYVGGNVNFAGQGYKLEAGRPDSPDYDVPRDVLFPTGSAAVLRAADFRELGGFDERYFMFFEDVDLGWRLNLAGHRVRYVPSSLVYHKHHAAIAKFGSFREQYLLARNGLMTIYKNFGEDMRNAALGPALLLSVHAGLRLGAADPTALDLQVTQGGDDEPTLTLDKQALAGAYAVDYIASHLAELTEERTRVQRTRVRSDAALAPLFGDLFVSTSPAPGYHSAFMGAVDAFGLRDRMRGRHRVLVITTDTLSPRMAGPAIRAFNIAAQLCAEHEVTLVSTQMCTLTDARFDCEEVTDTRLRQLADWCDIVIFQGFVMHQAPWLRDLDKIIVVDIYDPMHLEQLEQDKHKDPVEHQAELTGTVRVLNDQLERGDFFLCATEEQRHFWLGQLAAVGRLNAANYNRDSSLQSLLAVAPFGMAETKPARTRHAIKGVVPGIGDDDKVIMWGGGVYNWFDPLTLVLAVDKLRHEHDDIRLFFLGMKHPNPNVPEMRMPWETRQLADRLGLTDSVVFFNEEWVDYNDRHNYLLDADVGVSTHFLHVETTFSFRTRMLDYLWAGLPIVATGGDAFGRLIASENLGVAVGEQDVDGLADALARTLYDSAFRDECRANVQRVAEQFTWHRTLAPLIEFCRHAERAADAATVARRGSVPRRRVPTGPFTRNAYYARERLREGGTRLVLRQGWAKARRLAGARR
ncbi:MAG: glycosyltransferase, partial [Mycobacteriales bacterium]